MVGRGVAQKNVALHCRVSHGIIRRCVSKFSIFHAFEIGLGPYLVQLLLWYSLAVHILRICSKFSRLLDFSLQPKMTFCDFSRFFLITYTGCPMNLVPLLTTFKLYRHGCPINIVPPKLYSLVLFSTTIIFSLRISLYQLPKYIEHKYCRWERSIGIIFTSATNFKRDDIAE
jgi:hypothetical protein